MQYLILTFTEHGSLECYDESTICHNCSLKLSSVTAKLKPTRQIWVQIHENPPWVVIIPATICGSPPMGKNIPLEQLFIEHLNNMDRTWIMSSPGATMGLR